MLSPDPSLVREAAEKFAAQLAQVAATADKEEAIRIACERELGRLEDAAGIRLRGEPEFTVASGFVDSVYDRVIIEYKNPSSPADRIGPSAQSPGTLAVVGQIKSRFTDLQQEQGQPLNTLFGVGLDGKYFVFVRYLEDSWRVQPPIEVNKYSSERFLWALFNLGIGGKGYTPAQLAKDF